MTKEPKTKFVDNYDELKELVPGYKTKVKIDSDKDSEWMIYKGKEKDPLGKSHFYSFIEILDPIENDKEFIVWSSWDTYLMFHGDDCLNPELRNSIIFTHLHYESKVITPASEEYEAIKNLVKLWITE